MTVMTTEGALTNFDSFLGFFPDFFLALPVPIIQFEQVDSGPILDFLTRLNEATLMKPGLSHCPGDRRCGDCPDGLLLAS